MEWGDDGRSGFRGGAADAAAGAIDRALRGSDKTVEEAAVLVVVDVAVADVEKYAQPLSVDPAVYPRTAIANRFQLGPWAPLALVRFP